MKVLKHSNSLQGLKPEQVACKLIIIISLLSGFGSKGVHYVQGSLNKSLDCSLRVT